MLFCKKNAHDEKFYWTSCFLLIINVFVADARVAQLVEQRTENPRVGGSIPSPSTISKALNFKVFFMLGSNRASLKNSLSWGRAPLWHLTFAAYAFAFSLKKMTKMLQRKTAVTSVVFP